MTDKILSDLFPVYGFCPYDKVKDSLIECRAKARLPENAKTVIVGLFPYFLGDDAYEGSDISKYAVVPDYHNVLSEILSEACGRLKAEYPEEEFAGFADNSPIPEVKAAVNAGLGVKGRNGLLINRKFGSWVFIGEIVTTKEYPCADIMQTGCLNCGRCIDACPTGSITAEGINKSTCLSEITQRKGELSEAEQALIKSTGCAWGCDICQNACPMNKKAEASPLPAFRDGAAKKADAEKIDGRAYGWRGRKTIERNITILYKKEG